jgi:D-glycero-alpha-D-manno-heptose-7-phosphate kinase
MKFYGKSPVRISLCNGGDTDYYVKVLKWTNLINATLDSGTYSCEVEEKKQDFIDYSYKNDFLKSENYKRITDLDTEEEYSKLIGGTIKEINPKFRGDVKVWTNVPEKSGLGGSSALVVSLVKALLKTTNIQHITPEKIAWLAYKIERINLGMKGGYQDQWAAAFSGGVNYLEFKNKQVFLEPLWLSERLMKKLEENLVLFFIEPRKGGEGGNIHREMEKKAKSKKKEDMQTMLEKRDNVTKTRDALLNGDMCKFAEFLNNEHKNKLKLVKNLLTPKAEEIYSTALSQGALAGKISGAGSGGCAFFVYEGKDKRRFIRKMAELECINIPVKIQRLNTMGQF